MFLWFCLCQRCPRGWYWLGDGSYLYQAWKFSHLLIGFRAGVQLGMRRLVVSAAPASHYRKKMTFWIRLTSHWPRRWIYIFIRLTNHPSPLVRELDGCKIKQHVSDQCLNESLSFWNMWIIQIAIYCCHIIWTFWIWALISTQLHKVHQLYKGSLSNMPQCFGQKYPQNC